MGKESSAAKSSIEEVKARHEMEFLNIDGVEGIGIGDEKGKPVIRIYVSKKTKDIQKRIPGEVEGYPVQIEVSGEFHAL
jgi:hypothetical protein